LFCKKSINNEDNTHNEDIEKNKYQSDICLGISEKYIECLKYQNDININSNINPISCKQLEDMINYCIKTNQGTNHFSS
jgi:hypothetical protein